MCSEVLIKQIISSLKNTSLKKQFPLVIIGCLLIVISAYGLPLVPAKLTCEYIQNPLGIDTKTPRFSWTFHNTERNQLQSAYEIIVSDEVKLIQEGRGSSWTSGKVISSQNVQVEYAGNALKSFTRYY